MVSGTTTHRVLSEVCVGGALGVELPLQPGEVLALALDLPLHLVHLGELGLQLGRHHLHLGRARRHVVQVLALVVRFNQRGARRRKGPKARRMPHAGHAVQGEGWLGQGQACNGRAGQNMGSAKAAEGPAFPNEKEKVSSEGEGI